MPRTGSPAGARPTAATVAVAPATAEADDEPPRFALKPSQLAGGALASMTSAVAASFFGVTGTVVGAAFGSVVSGIAATVYATSLTRAGRRIRTVVVTPVGARGGTGVADPADPSAVPGELTGARAPVVGDTMISPNGPAWPPEPAARPEPGSRREPGVPRQEGPPATPSGAGPRRFAKPALIMAGFAFAASLGAVSATELALGHPVGNSAVQGTSVGGVLGGNAPRTPDPVPSPTPTGPSASPSETPSSEPTEASPSGSAPATGEASPGSSGDATPPGDAPAASPSPEVTDGGAGDATSPADGGATPPESPPAAG